MPLSKARSNKSGLLKNFQLVFFLLVSFTFMIQGWGGYTGLLSHPARVGVLLFIAVGFLILLFVPCSLFAHGERDISRQRWATYLALGMVGMLCWFLPYADRRALFVWPESDTLRYTGFVCTGIGIGFRIAGMIQLGARFSGFVSIQKKHSLLTTGCYRWVRHPIYAGSLLALAGIFLVFRSQLVVLGLPLYLAGTLWRIADEERFLTETFGEEYTRYRTRTWRFVPFIY